MNTFKHLLILVMWGILLSSCGQKEEQAQQETQVPEQVTTVRSEQRTYHPRLTYGGTLYAYREANLGTTLPGRVEKIHYEEGRTVKEGSLLVELSSELYAQALAEKNTLEKDFNRTSRLREKGSVTQQKYDHVKAKYQAAVAKARMMRKNCRIRAPFDGTIVDYLVREGENFMFSPSLKPGYSHTSGIVQLMQLDRLKVEVDINENDLPHIKEGQQARVAFDAYPDTTLRGTVTHIDPILSTSTHSAKVEVTIDNRNGTFKPGMYARLSIRLPEKTNVFVPVNAIIRQEGTGKDYVFIVENNRAVKKPVRKIQNHEELVAVEGIDENRQVIVQGKSKLNDSDPVTVKESKTLDES
ncbi:MAG TPA: efflux RND transporter periplasmic adaptor subunit [Bacteroidales bacterium]|nr:efflux RND transporter periplasmic adaptor subunit [Bacteroidales bacterium]